MSETGFEYGVGSGDLNCVGCGARPGWEHTEDCPVYRENLRRGAEQELRLPPSPAEVERWKRIEEAAQRFCDVIDSDGTAEARAKARDALDEALEPHKRRDAS